MAEQSKAVVQFIGIVLLAVAIVVSLENDRRVPQPLRYADVLKRFYVGMGLPDVRQLLSAYDRLGTEENANLLTEIYEPGADSGQLLDMTYVREKAGAWRLIAWATKWQLGRIPKEQRAEWNRDKDRTTRVAPSFSPLRESQKNLRYGMTIQESLIILSACRKFRSGGYLSPASGCSSTDYYDHEQNDLLILDFTMFHDEMRLSQWEYGKAPLNTTSH